MFDFEVPSVRCNDFNSLYFINPPFVSKLFTTPRYFTLQNQMYFVSSLSLFSSE